MPRPSDTRRWPARGHRRRRSIIGCRADRPPMRSVIRIVGHVRAWTTLRFSRSTVVATSKARAFMRGLFHGACVMMRPPPTWIVTHESGMPRCGRPGAAIVRSEVTPRLPSRAGTFPGSPFRTEVRMATGRNGSVEIDTDGGSPRSRSPVVNRGTARAGCGSASADLDRQPDYVTPDQRSGPALLLYRNGTPPSACSDPTTSSDSSGSRAAIPALFLPLTVRNSRRFCPNGFPDTPNASPAKPGETSTANSDESARPSSQDPLAHPRAIS